MKRPAEVPDVEVDDENLKNIGVQENPNLVAIAQAKPLPASFNGYSSLPIRNIFDMFFDYFRS